MTEAEATGSSYINNREKRNRNNSRRRRENRRKMSVSVPASFSTRRLMSAVVSVSSVGMMGMSSSSSSSIISSPFSNMYCSAWTTTMMPSSLLTKKRRLITTTLPSASRYYDDDYSRKMMMGNRDATYHTAQTCRLFMTTPSSSIILSRSVSLTTSNLSSSALRNSSSSSSSLSSSSSSSEIAETMDEGKRGGRDASFKTEKDDTATTTTSKNPFATTYHAPVMWNECIDALLDCERGRSGRGRGRDSDRDGDLNDNEYGRSERGPLIFVDGTLGGGGHSEALLGKLDAGDVVFGCDVDPNALRTASDRLQHYMDHDLSEKPLFVPVQTNFCDIATKLPTIEYPPSSAPTSLRGKRIIENSSSGPGNGSGVDGILLDLGVSSHQIDEPERGFSFMKDRDGPLDMRMSAGDGSSSSSTYSSSDLTAADIVNEFDATELQKIFSRYGDEPRAKTVAGAIVKHRPMTTTGQLVDAIASVTPKFAKNKRKGRTATCARIFQSLRIVVNNEDGVLDRVLSEACATLLRPGGRLVVLSYHSMEDRATKRIMRDGTLNNDELRRQRRNPFEGKDMYGNYVGPAKPFKPVGKRRRATEQEIDENPRARSATLRVAERQPKQ